MRKGRSMLRPGTCVLCLVAVTGLSSANDLTVDYTDGLLSIRCEAVPLETVFERIAERTGMEMLLDDAIATQPLTADVDAMPPKDAIETLLDGAHLNYALVLEPGNRSRVLRMYVGGAAGGALVPFSPKTESEAPARDPLAPDPSDDARERERNVEAFLESREQNTVEGLRDALTDEDTDVREAAIEALAELGGDEAAEALSAALSDPDSWLREDAVRALQEIGGEVAARALGAALGDTEPFVREEALDALTRIGGAASAQALGSALDHPDPEIRESAVEALGEIEAAGTLGFLERALTDQDPSVRRAAERQRAELKDDLTKKNP